MKLFYIYENESLKPVLGEISDNIDSESLEIKSDADIDIIYNEAGLLSGDRDFTITNGDLSQVVIRCGVAGNIVLSPFAGTNITLDTTGVGVISLDSVSASNFTVSGADQDLTLGARGTTVTLNESGETALSGFTATSLIGGLNEVKTFKEEAFLPIGWARDGSSPPASEEDITSGNGTVSVRKFSSSSVEDIVIPWQVPADIVAGDGVTFRVAGIITEATAPAASEGVSFKLSGYSVGIGDSINGTFGTEVESAIVDLNGSNVDTQYDAFYTTESSAVTITDLAAGEMAFLHFERDTADSDDDYGQDVGIVGIIIKYSKQTVGA